MNELLEMISRFYLEKTILVTIIRDTVTIISAVAATIAAVKVFSIRKKYIAKIKLNDLIKNMALANRRLNKFNNLDDFTIDDIGKANQEYVLIKNDINRYSKFLKRNTVREVKKIASLPDGLSFDELKKVVLDNYSSCITIERDIKNRIQDTNLT